MQATVCSLLPYELHEKKPGLIPDEFIVPKSNGIIPSTLVINDCVMPIYRGGEMQSFRSSINGDQVAKSVADCFNISQLGATSDCHPAVFSVPGAFTDGTEVIKRFPEIVKEAKDAQNRWFNELIKMADDDWGRNHRHKTITDIQRFAARSLGQVNKPWYSSPEPVKMDKCPACSSLVESSAAICMHCRAILKPEEAKKLGIVFASGT